MLRRILGDNLHWRIGDRNKLSVHFGLHRHGNCWKILALPKVDRYFNQGITWFSWWRLFFVVER